MKLIWKILSYSPLKDKKSNAFNILWGIGLFAAMIGATWNDDIWNHKGPATEEDLPPGFVDELTIEEWNDSPLTLGDGRCMIIKTREYINC